MFVLAHIKNKELLEKYFSPYIWSGSFTIDGGWGDKDKVMSIIDQDSPTNLAQSFKTLNLPFVVIPTNKLDPTTRVESDKKYNVWFAGEQFAFLFHYINTLEAQGISNYEFTLYSFEDEDPPKPGSDLYKAILKRENDITTLNIVKLNWIPSLDSSIPCLGFNL